MTSAYVGRMYAYFGLSDTLSALGALMGIAPLTKPRLTQGTVQEAAKDALNDQYHANSLERQAPPSSSSMLTLNHFS